MNEKVSVIIPACGDSERIMNCIESVLGLDYPDYELILVDDGLSQRIISRLSVFEGRLKLLKSGGKGPSYARNMAVKEAKASLIAFTDSDCIVEKNWLTELSRGLSSDTQAVSCGGAQGVPDDASSFEKSVYTALKISGFLSDYLHTSSSIRRVSHNPSCNVIYKKDILEEEGGFAAGLWPGEDVELDHRLRRKGYRLLFNPAALVYHYRPHSLGKFISMMLRYGKVQAWLVKRYGFFRRVHFVPAALLFFAAALFLAPGAAFVLWPGVFIASAVVLLRSCPETRRISGCFKVLILVFVLFLSWNCGFFSGLLGRSKWRDKTA